ncbi:hypothetical protein PHYBOEH_006043 [Phytophthora boehmeriae]|uniref:Uncharacterized protein n=1 Tax=Phytophthora boehmeriae TaxID=109152 RepID=A0A8T1WKD2_9STRA|nr:hypothetical protein PHYBOEH_006043 [Phytophthora boehmeriae]
MSHARAGADRAMVAVDVDHALAKLLDCAAAWHEAQHGKAIDVDAIASSRWTSVWGTDDESKTEAFYHSKQFETDVQAAAGVTEALKPLRKFFSFLAVTDRPRSVEKQTREWLDQHFPGVFDKLLFVDEDCPEHLVSRKKELYEEFKVKVAVGSDASVLTEAAEDVSRAIVVGSVPWTKTTGKPRTGMVQVAEWSAVRAVLDQIIKDLELKPVDKVFAGPRLARYTDDLVTVSTRKPAVFYANIINSKFTVQKQETVRLQASEGAITTAVQASEILRLQNNAVTTKIFTRYALNRPKERGGYRVPKLELVLQRVAPNA